MGDHSRYPSQPSLLLVVVSDQRKGRCDAKKHSSVAPEYQVLHGLVASLQNSHSNIFDT